MPESMTNQAMTRIQAPTTSWTDCDGLIPVCQTLLAYNWTDLGLRHCGG